MRLGLVWSIFRYYYPHNNLLECPIYFQRNCQENVNSREKKNIFPLHLVFPVKTELATRSPVSVRTWDLAWTLLFFSHWSTFKESIYCKRTEKAFCFVERPMNQTEWHLLPTGIKHLSFCLSSLWGGVIKNFKGIIGTWAEVLWNTGIIIPESVSGLLRDFNDQLKWHKPISTFLGVKMWAFSIKILGGHNNESLSGGTGTRARGWEGGNTVTQENGRPEETVLSKRLWKWYLE